MIERRLLEEQVESLGREMRSRMPRGAEFALLMFDLGAGGHLAYCSSARREDMLRALRELVVELERRTC